MNKISMMIAKYFLFVLAFSIFPLSSYAATMYVEKYGDDFSACTRADPCNKIQDAIDTARVNSKILVGPGVYEENLVIRTKGIKLESTAGVTATQIRGDLATANVPAITIEADLVSIGRKFGKGFTIYADNAPAVKVGKSEITGCEESFGSYFPVEDIVSTSRSKIEGNSIHTYLDHPTLISTIANNCDNTGALVYSNYLAAIDVYGTDTSISENVIVSQGNFVVSLEIITRSTVLNNVMKLQLDDAPPYSERHEALRVDGFLATNLIRGNVVHDDRSDVYRRGTGSGISVSGLKTTVSNNQVSGFDYGIDSYRVRSIDKNIVTSAFSTGIRSFNDKIVRDNTVTSNEADKTRTGILLVGMQNGLFTGNTVVDHHFNGVFIDLHSSSWIRVFSANNIYNNGDPTYSDCGIYIREINKPIRILRTWFGDVTSPRDIISGTGLSPTGTPGDHICAYPGMIDNSTGTINNLKVTPSRVPNRVKAIFRRVAY